MNSDTISPNLTFEEFKEYADRQPSLDGNWIYRLENIWMLEDSTMYPEFETRSHEYYFHTFDEAEKFIKEKLTGPENGSSDSYCFVISQLAVGCLSSWSDIGASWLYDHEGRLIDYSITTWEDAPYKSAFFGRSAERMRFKKGDIVEVINHDSVNLAVVAADGPSVEWFWGLYNRIKDKRGGYFADASDDCYYILDGPGFVYHSHVPAPNSLRMSFSGTCSHGTKREVNQKRRAAPATLKSTITIGATTPAVKTIFATGDISPHITLAPNIAKCPLALFISMLQNYTKIPME